MKDIVENTKVGTSRRFTQPTLSKVENGQLPLLEWSDVVVLLEAIGATAEERQTARRQYDITVRAHRQSGPGFVVARSLQPLLCAGGEAGNRGYPVQVGSQPC